MQTNDIVKVLSLFKKGNAVEEPIKWKNFQISSTVVTSVFVALANVLTVFGVAVPVDPTTLNAAAVAFISAVNVVLTFTTSDKVGIGE